MQEVLAVDFFSRCESEMLAGGGVFPVSDANAANGADAGIILTVV